MLLLQGHVSNIYSSIIKVKISELLKKLKYIQFMTQYEFIFLYFDAY